MQRREPGLAPAFVCTIDVVLLGAAGCLWLTATGLRTGLRIAPPALLGIVAVLRRVAGEVVPPSALPLTSHRLTLRLRAIDVCGEARR